MQHIEITAENLLEIDNQLIAEGIEPYHRAIASAHRISNKFNLLSTFKNIFESAKEIESSFYKKVYREQDLLLPPMYVGCFMFRDIFLEIRIPPASYGRLPVDILCQDALRIKNWMFQDFKIVRAYYDQIIDIYDFIFGLDDLEKEGIISKETIEFWWLAKEQLEGAASTLLGSFSKYTAIQNSLYAIELLLKGALYHQGYSKEELRDIQHNLKALSNRVVLKYPNIDKKRLIQTCCKMPDVITRRYEAQKYTRIELGNIVMQAQYVAGEILRQVSDRNLREQFTRADIKLNRKPLKIIYPNI